MKAPREALAILIIAVLALTFLGHVNISPKVVVHKLEVEERPKMLILQEDIEPLTYIIHKIKWPDTVKYSLQTYPLFTDVDRDGYFDFVAIGNGKTEFFWIAIISGANCSIIKSRYVEGTKYWGNIWYSFDKYYGKIPTIDVCLDDLNKPYIIVYTKDDRLLIFGENLSILHDIPAPYYRHGFSWNWFYGYLYIDGNYIRYIEPYYGIVWNYSETLGEEYTDLYYVNDTLAFALFRSSYYGVWVARFITPDGSSPGIYKFNVSTDENLWVVSWVKSGDKGVEEFAFIRANDSGASLIKYRLVGTTFQKVAEVKIDTKSSKPYAGAIRIYGSDSDDGCLDFLSVRLGKLVLINGSTFEISQTYNVSLSPFDLYEAIALGDSDKDGYYEFLLDALGGDYLISTNPDKGIISSLFYSTWYDGKDFYHEGFYGFIWYYAPNWKSYNSGTNLCLADANGIHWLGYDADPPKITSVIPGNNSAVKGPDVRLFMNASDPTTPAVLARVSYWHLNGSYVTIYVPYDEKEALFIANLTIDSSYETVCIYVYDACGHYVYAHVEWFVSNLPPYFASISIPADGAYLNTKTVTIEWTIDDDDLGDTLTLQIFLDGVLVYSAVDEYFGSYDLTLNEGSHTVKVVVTDSAGRTASVSSTFTVDLTKPIVKILTPKEGEKFESNTVEVAWMVTDNFGVKYVMLKLDDKVQTIVTENGTHTFSNLKRGTHTVTVIAIDYAGNVAEAKVTFSIVIPRVVVIGISAIIAVAAIFIAYFLFFRRR